MNFIELENRSNEFRSGSLFKMDERWRDEAGEKGAVSAIISAG